MEWTLGHFGFARETPANSLDTTFSEGRIQATIAAGMYPL
jgi:hypothetical protein